MFSKRISGTNYSFMWDTNKYDLDMDEIKYRGKKTQQKTALDILAISILRILHRQDAFGLKLDSLGFKTIVWYGTQHHCSALRKCVTVTVV